MLQLSVASCQLAMAAACGMWHLLLHFWPEGKQKYACKVGTESGAPIQSGFYLLPFVCAFFDNLPPFLLPNKHLFVCFSISQRALFIRQHTDTHTHTQCRKYSRRSGRRGKDKAELAICPRIDIKIARLLSLWHSDNFAHLCCLLLCAAYQCNCACQLFGCQVKCVHLR